MMPLAIRQVVTVGSGGVVEVRSSELHEGDQAEVTVVVKLPAGSASPGGWRRYAGAVNSKDLASADNPRIDADLAAEYGRGTKAGS